MILNVSYLLIVCERRASAAGSLLQHNVYRVPTYDLGCIDIKEPRQENAKTKHTKKQRRTVIRVVMNTKQHGLQAPSSILQRLMSLPEDPQIKIAWLYISS